MASPQPAWLIPRYSRRQREEAARHLMGGSYNAIVVGGGHNGLVAGAYFAKAGASTVVLESRSKVGGAVDTSAPFPNHPEIMPIANATPNGVAMRTVTTPRNTVWTIAADSSGRSHSESSVAAGAPPQYQPDRGAPWCTPLRALR